MRLSTININGKEIAAVAVSTGLITIKDINMKYSQSWEEDIYSLICKGQLKEFNLWFKRIELNSVVECIIPYSKAVYAPLYRNPQRIFGIGLNYVEHAADLEASTPEEFPGCFFKPASSIVGYGDWVKIPKLASAEKTTGEAELAIIIGKDCQWIEEEDWEEAVIGYTTILDMTEESILRRNPRFLTMAKGFETFLSFGPQLITPDEIKDVSKLEIQTVYNGEVYAANRVSAMRHSPKKLVSLISKTQGWLSGDILLTGTPRAVELKDKDVIECRIVGEDGFGFESLKNPVMDLKSR